MATLITTYRDVPIYYKTKDDFIRSRAKEGFYAVPQETAPYSNKPYVSLSAVKTAIDNVLDRVDKFKPVEVIVHNSYKRLNHVAIVTSITPRGEFWIRWKASKDREKLWNTANLYLNTPSNQIKYAQVKAIKDRIIELEAKMTGILDSMERFYKP